MLYQREDHLSEMVQSLLELPDFLTYFSFPIEKLQARHFYAKGQAQGSFSPVVVIKGV